jgi:SAM-dependent methyltransferase
MEQQNSLIGIPHLSFPKRLLFLVLRIFFKLLYHQFAWAYDWVASVVSLGAWQTWVQSVVPYLDGPRTLELGFGPGHLQVTLIHKGNTVYGLDESLQMNKLARRRLLRLNLPANLVRGNAQTLPFADECFHQVVMTFPAEYILNHLTLLDIHRVLVKGGAAYILPLAWLTGHKPLDRFVAWINRLTGEAPEWDEKYLQPLKTVGFEVTWDMVNLTSSKVLIIKLFKPIAK